MKNEEFAFNMGGLLGFSLPFFSGLMTGGAMMPMLWRSLVLCMFCSVIAKFSTRFFMRVRAVSMAPTIEELPELPHPEEEESQKSGEQSLPDDKIAATENA